VNGNVRKGAWLVSLVGLLLFVGVLVYQGIGAVFTAVAAVGWGLVWIALFHLAPLVADTWAWRALLESREPVGFAELTRIAWIGEAVNSLLPVALIGGGVLRTRLLCVAGVPTDIAGASVLVDLTVAVATLVLFAFAGLLALTTNTTALQNPAELLPGLLLFSAFVGAFYLAQRRGLFLMLARRMQGLLGDYSGGIVMSGAAGLDHRVAEIYARRRALGLAFVLRLAGWIVGAGEVWLALRWLGYPVGVGDALAIEALGQTVRSAAFIVPGALGVQEGAYLVLAASIGIPPQTGVALSLVKRVRELSLGVPALLAWQMQEFASLRRRPKAEAGMPGLVD